MKFSTFSYLTIFVKLLQDFYTAWEKVDEVTLALRMSMLKHSPAVHLRIYDPLSSVYELQRRVREGCKISSLLKFC